jgi:3-(3-hydroxy-phenyl)propionate hydroxylase
MQVTGDRYRWEFQLRGGEDETDLIADLGRLLQPWTGQPDLAGLEVTRSAVYTFRARLATRFQVGRAFLLGDAAHLTPPFIGQGLAAGIRDADNLAWKVAYVLAGRATSDLLTTYHTERRPHAKAMIRKAKLVGWAMTGGQDAAAAVRRLALAVAVRSTRVRDAVASTATPRLRSGALQHTPRRSRPPRPLRVGALIPNPPLYLAGGKQVRLDDVLDGVPTMLTARRPEPRLLEVCQRHGVTLVRVTADPGADPTDTGWIDARLPADCPSRLHALVHDPSLTVLVRPDRVIAAVTTRSQPPRPPWTIP